MPKTTNKERSMALYESILELKSLEECIAFFDDLCTVGELRAMEQRYDVATLLDEGLVYTEILRRGGLPGDDPAPQAAAGALSAGSKGSVTLKR